MTNQRLRIILAFVLTLIAVAALLASNVAGAGDAAETFKWLAVSAAAYLFGTVTNGSGKPLG